MVRKIVIATAVCAGMFAASSGLAKEYRDYAPEKGVWQINAIEVDPNHVDDYLTGLRRSQVPGFEIMKRHGIIDAYRFIVRNGYTKGAPNVLIETHYSSVALLAPDQARDAMIEKEIYANFSEDAGKTAVAGYEKYRQFIDRGLWTELKIAQ